MNTPSFPEMQEVKTFVYMQGITSDEYYLREGEAPVPILNGVDLTIERDQIFGVDGNSLFEIKLLLEIMANIRSYKSGRCVLHERGMMRRKHIILPHVFYIGDPNMAYSSMNVLEFMMFSAMKKPGDKILFQEQMLEYLIKIGLQRIALTPIHSLPREHRAVVLLLVSALSESNLIVFNLPECRYDDNLRTAIRYIAKLFLQRNKTLVLSTQDAELIEMACTNMAMLVNGVIEYHGTVQDFSNGYDHILMTIQDDNADEIMENLHAALPQFTYALQGDELNVSNNTVDDEAVKTIYQQLLKSNYTPNTISVNRRTIKNAREEFMKHYAVY